MNFSHADSAAALATAEAEPVELARATPRLLIVDDVRDNRVVLARRFERRGFEIVEASSGAEALELIAAGGAPINALAQAAGAGLEAFDLAVERPVGDITARAAMSERECAATMAFGMEALAKQPDLLVLGDIVTGAPVSAAAIALALYGGEPGDWTEQDAERSGSQGNWK